MYSLLKINFNIIIYKKYPPLCDKMNRLADLNQIHLGARITFAYMFEADTYERYK